MLTTTQHGWEYHHRGEDAPPARMTPTMRHVLLTIEKIEPCTPSKLSAELRRKSVYEHLAELFHNGWIMRRKTRVNERPQYLYKSTRSGYERRDNP